MTLPTIIEHTAHGSPLLFDALWTAVFLHIGGGSVGIVSGAAAITVRKGERLHRLFGTIFFASMLTMAGAAIFMALLIPEQPNVLAGVFAFYLVASAWMTVRRKEGTTGLYEKGALVFALAATAIGLTFGVQAAMGHAAKLNGFTPPSGIFFVFAAVAAFAAALDLKVILRGGISGAPRIARHAWRMCTGLFIATGSFFLGQQKVMPHWMHGSPVLLALGVAPLVLMVFWLLRIRFTKAFKTAAAAAV